MSSDIDKRLENPIVMAALDRIEQQMASGAVPDKKPAMKQAGAKNIAQDDILAITAKRPA